jgi:hypothetical protein
MKKILSIVAAVGLALGLATSAQAQYGVPGHGGLGYRGPSFGGHVCNYPGNYQQPGYNHPGQMPNYPPMQQPMPRPGYPGYPGPGFGGINVNPNIDIDITINTILGNNNVINNLKR